MKQRLLNIDLVKIVAMFAVIGLHTFCGSRGYDFAHLFYMSCVVGVPFFFMSSGYLLLGRSDICYQYVGIKIWHIFRVVLILSVIYSVIAFLYIETNPFILFIDCFWGSFIQRGELWICWYLGAMVIIYLLLPLINKLYINNYKFFLFFLFVLFLIELFIFYLNVSENGWEKNIVQTFRVWNWLFYFCLGGLLNTKCKFHVKNVVLIPVCLLVLIYNVVFQENFYEMIGENACEFFYCSFVVIISTTIAFLLLSRVKINKSMNNKILFFSKLLLPVYLLHPFVLSIIMQPYVFSKVHFDWMPFYMFRFIFVSIVTILLSWTLLKIEVINRIFKI